MHEIAKAADTTTGCLCRHEKNEGSSFVLNGHRITIESPRRKYTPRTVCEPEPEPEPARCGPVDFTARALSDRKAYDSHGIARLGVLIRRPA
ncbi:MAG: hypothetical protein PHS14_18640 [Elusimicrobia bacterium]|nr:hypothetical protein [Elusimicrobiota bacterium]